MTKGALCTALTTFAYLSVCPCCSPACVWAHSAHLFDRVCLRPPGSCTLSLASINCRSPVLLGHELWAGVRDPDVSLAVHGMQNVHRVPAAPPRGRDDVLWQVRQRIPHFLRWHELHTYRWAAEESDGFEPTMFKHRHTKRERGNAFLFYYLFFFFYCLILFFVFPGLWVCEVCDQGFTPKKKGGGKTPKKSKSAKKLWFSHLFIPRLLLK